MRRSSSAESVASSVSFGSTQVQSFCKRSADKAVKAAECGNLVKWNSFQAKPNARTDPSGSNQRSTSGQTEMLDCESMFEGLSTAGSNAPQYQTDIFEQRFKSARNHCFTLLSTDTRSVDHLEAWNSLNQMIHSFKWYSGYLRTLLQNVANCDATLSQLNNHNAKVKEIQQLQNLVLEISENTENKVKAEPPTTTQVLTFINNMKKE